MRRSFQGRSGIVKDRIRSPGFRAARKGGTHRTDLPPDAGGDRPHLGERAPLAEDSEPRYSVTWKRGRLYARLAQVDGDFWVA